LRRRVPLASVSARPRYCVLLAPELTPG